MMKTTKILILIALIVMLGSCRSTFSIIGTLPKASTVCVVELEDYCGAPDVILNTGMTDFSFENIYPGKYFILVFSDSINYCGTLKYYKEIEVSHRNLKVNITGKDSWSNN